MRLKLPQGGCFSRKATTEAKQFRSAEVKRRFWVPNITKRVRWAVRSYSSSPISEEGEEYDNVHVLPYRTFLTIRLYLLLSLSVTKFSVYVIYTDFSSTRLLGQCTVAGSGVTVSGHDAEVQRGQGHARGPGYHSPPPIPSIDSKHDR